MSEQPSFEMIAKTFQGLEEILAQELTELGADNIEIGRILPPHRRPHPEAAEALHCPRRRRGVQRGESHPLGRLSDDGQVICRGCCRVQRRVPPQQVRILPREGRHRGLLPREDGQAPQRAHQQARCVAEHPHCRKYLHSVA